MTDQEHEEGRFRITVRELSFLLTILTLVVTFATAWGALNEKVEVLNTEINKQAERIVSMETTIIDGNKDTVEMKVQLARIETDLAYIRSWIDKQEDIRGNP